MMIRRLASLFTTCLLAGCSSGVSEEKGAPLYPSPMYQPSVSGTDGAGSAASRAKARETVRQDLARFEAERSPDCNSPDLLDAQAGLSALESASADPASGSLALDVADAAREKGCEDAAGVLYEQIMRTYVGAGYVSLRARAETGMQRLKAGPG